MDYLCLDTTTIDAGVTIIRNHKSYYQKIEPMRASETLLKTVDECLKKMKFRPSDLTGVLVIKGPGSFTGLRVGIAIANQFAHQLKIPIIGLRTDEWWRHRTEENDFLYLQSMNRGEAYIVRYTQNQPDFPVFESIEPIDSFKKTEGSKMVWGALADDTIKWLGQLNEDHRQQLSADYQKITNLLSVEETWKKMADSLDWKKYKDYELVEPFYGKAPNITVSKRKGIA